jgi:hypothetical protein
MAIAPKLDHFPWQNRQLAVATPLFDVPVSFRYFCAGAKNFHSDVDTENILGFSNGPLSGEKTKFLLCDRLPLVLAARRPASSRRRH